MSGLGTNSAGRVLGDSAVLERLERLGRQPRIFPNLTHAGFPPEQLSTAGAWFMRDAQSAVERHACQQVARGFFEDETLLRLFCRYFECTDWKLEKSPWFFSRADYQRFFAALIRPVAFETAQIEAGLGEERWGEYFLKLPFDLGMEQAKRALWTAICRQEHYWKPLADYTHWRAAQLLHYLQRTLDIVHFTPDQFHYHWEREFRRQLYAALRGFSEALEGAARRWQEQRKERARGFTQGAFSGSDLPVLHLEVLQALSYLELDVATADAARVRAAFRRRSKRSHPDHGGDPAEFLKLSRYRDVLEGWLKSRARG
jgi:hypothetical protein